jgi:hypothetical protein
MYVPAIRSDVAGEQGKRALAQVARVNVMEMDGGRIGGL